MNLEDFARINRILTSFEPQTPGIKLINSKRKSYLFEEFENDLEFFNSCGGCSEVSRVLIYGCCFFEIRLKDSSTPYIYYFTSCFDDVVEAVSGIAKICRDRNVSFEILDEKLIL